MKDTICYNNFVDKMKLGENCRALWLAVIQQTVADSMSQRPNDFRDLPRVLCTEWWQLLFALAGIENEIEKVNKIIIKNCQIREQAKEKGIKKPTFTVERRKFFYRRDTSRK